jgi:hypothetical protein
VDADPAARADRLWLLLALFRGVPTLEPRDAFGATFRELTRYGVAVAEAVDEADLGLASEALTIEAEIRVAQYDALERLGSLVAAGEGTLDERIRALSGGELLAAVASLLALGWLDRHAS